MLESKKINLHKYSFVTVIVEISVQVFALIVSEYCNITSVLLILLHFTYS